MYPFKDDACLVRNRWYIAGFAAEITRQPIERTILNVPMVLYRTEAGKPVAMYGLCPHRYYPLARGHVAGDSIVCGYHGFTFGSDGKCIHMPGQGTGAGFRQPTYRLEECGPLVWVWTGDAERCDPGLIPPYDDFGLDQPGWVDCAHTYFPMKGRSQLLVDNLMDLTHLPFLHQQVGIGEAFLQKTLEGEQRPRSFCLRRPSRMPWTPFHEFLFTSSTRFEGLSSMESVTDFYGPEFIRTSGPITTSIDGRDNVPVGIGKIYFLHGITPETDHSTHYFGVTTRNFRLNDPEFDHALRETTLGVRKQDVDAIEAVESRLDAAVRRQRELLCRSDAPAIKVRQVVQDMLDQEKGALNAARRDSA
jgi:nitrite reductase/ring-hydroxylating ferredoxin subunit